MARRKKPQNMNDDLLLDETLGDDSFLDDSIIDEGDGSQELSLGVDEEAEEWETDDSPGQLAVDIYETPKKLIVKARVAGINRDDLDVSITDNKLTISGTLSSGDEIETENFHVQECYWGEFRRDIALPVSVKEDEVDAVLKDGVLTISFNKVKQETVKKIQIS